MSDSDENAPTLATGFDGPIEVIVPASIEMASMLRLVCAALGAEAGLSLDEVDDLRLAAGEVFAAAVDAENADRVSVTFEARQGEVAVMYFMVGPATIELDELGTQILRSGVDELEMSAGTVRFVKRTDQTDRAEY